MAYLICIISALLIFIAYNCIQPLSVWIHLILSPFIYGISKFKIDFFLLYFSILSILALMPWQLKSRSLIFKLKITNFLVIFSALIMGFLSFILFIFRFSLPLEKYAYHFKDHFHSINYFAHIHTSKTAIFYLLDLLGLDHFNKICDTGLVFADHVNPYIIFFLSFFTILSFLLFLALLKPTLEKWNPNKRFFIFFIYAFAGAHILKCLIDGGIFSYDLLPSLIALHLLCFSHDARSLVNNFRKWRSIYLLITTLYLGICAFISLNEAFLQVPIGLIFSVCIYTILFMPLFAHKVLSFRAQVILLICLLYISFYWSMHGLGGIKTMSSKIQKGDIVLNYNYSTPDAPPIITNHSEDMIGKKIIDVYLQLGENPFRNRRVAIIKADQEKTTGFIFILKILKSKGDIKLESTPLIRIDKITPFKKYGDKAYYMEISFNPYLVPPLWSKHISILNQNNKYCVLYVLNHYFLQRGITEYAVIPYYFYNVGGFE